MMGDGVAGRPARLWTCLRGEMRPDGAKTTSNGGRERPVGVTSRAEKDGTADTKSTGQFTKNASKRCRTRKKPCNARGEDIAEATREKKTLQRAG